MYLDSTTLGGAEVVLGRLLAALPEQIRVTIIGVDDAVVTWLLGRRPDSETVLLAPISGRNDIGGFLRHRSVLKRLGADVVQFNLSTGSSCQWAMLAATTVPGLKRIALEHSSMGAWSPTSARLKRLTERYLDAHVAVGARTARLLEDSSGLARGTIRTIYHGVTPAPHEDVSRPVGPTLLNVARHDPVKGVSVLLDAMTHLRTDANLVLVGDGAQTQTLKERCSALGIDDRVEFRGPTWGASGAAAIMGCFDLFVLPSHVEGFPVTVVEAMLAGLPVVATDVGSVREQLTDGETGWIVPPDDPDALAEAIDDALADSGEARRRASAARSYATRHFTIESTVKAWTELYTEILA